MSQSAYCIDWNTVHWWWARKMRYHWMKVSDFMIDASLLSASVGSPTLAPARSHFVRAIVIALRQKQCQRCRGNPLSDSHLDERNKMRRPESLSQGGLVVECRGTRTSAVARSSDVACSEMRIAVSRMTVLRPKVSMCRCEGSPSPHGLSFTRVRNSNPIRN